MVLPYGKNNRFLYLVRQYTKRAILEAIGDSQDTAITGTVFQIDVRMKREEDVKRAYEILKEGSKTNVPLGPSFFSPCMVDFVDKFGVRWCLFAE
jgi:PhnB protein